MTTASVPHRISVSVLAVCGLLLLVGGCSSLRPDSAPLAPVTGPPRVMAESGFEAKEGTGDGAGWWLSSANGTFLVTGHPSTTAFVTLSLSPPPCGPARLRLDERDLGVPAGYSVSLSVRIPTSGLARVPIFSLTTGCHLPSDARALYAFVSNAKVMSAPSAVGARPADGFGGAEQSSTGDSFWMLSPEGSIIAYGDSSTSVLVSITVAAPPCGATKVAVADRSHLVRGRTVITTRAALGPDGTAVVPVSTGSAAPCSTNQDPRSLRLLVSDVSARPDQP